MAEGTDAPKDHEGTTIMLGQLIQPELQTLIREKNFAELRETLRELSPPDLAELLADLDPTDMAVVFRVLPRQSAAELYEHLPLEIQETLLRALASEEVANLLNDMAPDDRTALLEELPGDVTRQLLALLSPSELSVAKSLLGYPEESVGRLMTPDYLAIHEGWTVREVLEHIRARGRDSETLNVLFVVDEKGTLIDEIRLRDVLLSPEGRKVADLMDRRYVALSATDDQETAVAAFRKYDRFALPVTDTQGVLVGIVTADDVLDVAEEEATEDIQKLGGLEALDLGYMATPLAVLVRKRAGWLVLLFLGELLTATAMGYFEDEISRAVVLALFVPLIISSGGNSGSQAASLIIRALALGEVQPADFGRILRRELVSGFSLGAILGAIGFLRIALWSVFTDLYGPHWLLIGLTIWLTLVGVVLWGTVAGSMLPIALKRLGTDPAHSSAPFVATLVDVTGIVIYFSVAALLLRGTLL